MSDTISIKFVHTDNNGDFYSAETRIGARDGFETTLDALGRAFNSFLKQIGYAFDKEYILMRSLDGDEYDALENYLAEYRQAHSDNGGAS